MPRRPASTKSERAFIDALREVLGLSPLYGSEDRTGNLKFARKFTHVSVGRRRGGMTTTGEGFDIYTGGLYR